MNAGNRFKLGMVDYCKIILGKISFDRKLFWKEYRKSFRYLDAEEQASFRQWVRENVRGSGNMRPGLGDAA